ncbi:unnamed protein product [Adineta steineri]|uniref:Protein kinase domain-containing protein n=1 Tax=Adineta steineri TaxID=433720 RepID=A0A815JY89_9BILA|nr:unnamed protein product [Adineta steineri]CAF1479825.1 unnamed protein product [Adineta steineri]
MGNKNTSPHLTKTLSINGHENHRFIQQHNVTNSDDTDNSFETSSYQSSNGKKYGPSPRFRRRRDNRHTHSDKKGKKPQPASSYLNVSLQSIGGRTVSLFSRSFNFLQQSASSSPICHSQNNRYDISLANDNHCDDNIGVHSGVYRNQSRRKYQTSSLRNPYRRSSTNFPVRGHEAMFLPEFSIKGKVTEADFEVIDIIARGAFGNVIKVSSIHDKQIYAMKIMSKSQIVKDHAVQQVKDEVTIAQSCLSHPFIVHTHHYWQSRRYLYIITDYVENGELLALWLRIRRFPELIVKIYIAQVAMVLDYLHNKGIIYRDVKMENILLDEHGNIKIIDFGLSKWLASGQRTTTICGTLQYIAPEVLSVRPYDHRVDWWSLGILMYVCLFGEYPVSAAKDHISMANKVLNHKFHLPLNGLENKTDIKELLYNLLEKNPKNRLCSLDSLRQTSFMSNISFDRIYSKVYSPITILMNTKIEWHNELKLHYYSREKVKINGNKNLHHSSSSSSCQQQNHYENLNDNFFPE